MLSVNMQAGNGWLAHGTAARALPIRKTRAFREWTPFVRFQSREMTGDSVTNITPEAPVREDAVGVRAASGAQDTRGQA